MTSSDRLRTDTPHRSIAFRPDIEGLRAVSIGLVLVFHASAWLLPGGYVGVDVFFVISGYLITTSLLAQHHSGASLGANLAQFWARRVRRLLPNALLVLLVTSLVAAWTLDDVSLARLGAEVGWSALDAANWLFLRRSSDYLRWGENEASVLLNYWSLAVEEQFYLVWPPILLLLWRRRQAPAAQRRAALAVAALLALASFAYMLSLGRAALTAAFFASPPRAWELMAGVALALLLRERTQPLPGGPLWAMAGLLAIAASALGFSAATVHPGWATLLPVLGAAAVIGGLHARPEATPARWLGCAPMRAIGARSYSIYLWHWPVLALGALWWPAHGWLAQAALLLASLLLAEAAYRWVETPARRGWVPRLPAPRVVGVGVAASLMLFATGAALVVGAETGVRRELLAGAPRGVPGLPPLRQVRADLAEVYRNGCHRDFPHEAPAEGCRYGPADAPAVLLFGDSHAAQWMPALQAAALARGMAVVSWTKSACPSADVTKWNPAMRGPYRECDRWREAVMQRLPVLQPALVVISNELDDAAEMVDRDSGERLSGAASAAAFDAGLRRTLERIRAAGIPVVLLRDSPRPHVSVLSCLYASPDPGGCARPRSQAAPEPARDVRVAQALGVPVWDLGDAICNSRDCPVVVPVGEDRRWQVVYRDKDHLTAGFTSMLVPALAREWDRHAPAAPLTRRDNRPAPGSQPRPRSRPPAPPGPSAAPARGRCARAPCGNRGRR